MNVLAIDTATDEAAVALLAAGRFATRPLAWRAAFRELTPAVDGLRVEAGLAWEAVDAIAVPAGPGSFTGLRVGAAFALALAALRAVPLHAPPTLAVVAEACAPRGADRVCASLDARRGRRYVALLARAPDGSWETRRGPLDVPPEEVAAVAGDAPVVALETPGDRPLVAAALATLVARAPLPYRLSEPGALRLLYARPGTS